MNKDIVCWNRLILLSLLDLILILDTRPRYTSPFVNHMLCSSSTVTSNLFLCVTTRSTVLRLWATGGTGTFNPSSFKLQTGKFLEKSP